MNEAKIDLGLELGGDGLKVGRDPRSLTTEELVDIGHKRMSPMAALRARCIDCCSGNKAEVRHCTAIKCPSWPFRMGKNPWRAPMSEERRVAAGERMARTQAARRAAGEPEIDEDEIEEDEVEEAEVVPEPEPPKPATTARRRA